MARSSWEVVTVSDWPDISIDVEAFDDYTGCAKYNAVYTITLAELMDSDIFDWSHADVSWSDAAYDAEQYARVCSYFIERFRYREISMLPYKQWANSLHRKLVYEIMPKYRPLYERLGEGIDPLSVGDEYKKSRVVDSEYPETLLSGNSDYASMGRDEEYEVIREGNVTELSADYAERFHGVDELVLDGLECMFISLYTANINTSW